MKLRLVTAQPRFGFDLAADLESRQLGSVTVENRAVNDFALRYRRGLPAAELAALLAAIEPLVPETVKPADEAELSGADAELRLGEPEPKPRTVHIMADSDAIAGKIRDLANSLGFVPHGEDLRLVEEDVLLAHEAPRFPRQLFRWYLLRLGIRAGERDHSPSGTDLGLFIRDPALASLPLTERYPVSIQTDDPEAGQALVARLKQFGFRCNPLVRMTDAEAESTPLGFMPGPFTQQHAAAEYSHLQVALTQHAQELGIDLGRYPVRVGAQERARTAVVHLPVAACRSRRKRPYSGPHPDRFTVTIVTDQADAVEPLREKLRAAGFTLTEVEVTPPLYERPPGDDDDDDEGPPFLPGFAVAWDAAGREPGIVELLRRTVQAEMDRVGAREFTLRTTGDVSVGDEVAVRIFFPVGGRDDGKLLTAVGNPDRFALKLLSPRPEVYNDLLADLKKWGFSRVETSAEEGRPGTVQFGGAPRELIDRVRRTVRERTGLELSPIKQWGDDDCDVFIALPSEEKEEKTEEKTPPPQEDVRAAVEAWAFGSSSETVGTFVRVTADAVHVGGVCLPRRQGPRDRLAPNPGSFVHFTLDRLTAATIEHIATAVLLREPCLLEGETSTSKTSSILYLASLLGQPVVRINLNGQSDTGELVGRFVPQHLADLPLSSQELHAASELLEHETKMILQRAKEENRPLTRVEVQQVMANEKMASHPWRWEDGLVVQAMKKGWWVLLDEVNLAEPQILERLNSVLEHEPSLVLTENDNSVIGHGGTPVHTDFRIFGTMNPAEYAGRSVLSPAYRDRWRGYRAVPRPGEEELLSMLRRLVFGQQPAADVNGRRYTGVRQEPVYPQLARVPKMEAYLEALARFHVALEHAAGQTSDEPARIGARRRERPVFTRRGILSVLEFLASPIGGGADANSFRRSLVRYYLARLSDPSDQKLVVELLDAHGIGPNTWSVDA